MIRRIVHRNPYGVLVVLVLAIIIGAVVFSLGGCGGFATAKPTKVIAFQGDTVPPSKGGLTIEIDMIFASGVTNVGTVYPAEYATAAPFIHFQTAEVGTVLSYSLKVFGIEPGEKVSCLISINGLVVDKHTAKFPKPAVCSGPPV